MQELLGVKIVKNGIYISYNRSYVSFINEIITIYHHSFKVEAAYGEKTWIEKISNLENLYEQYITGIRLKEKEINPGTSDTHWGYILETKLGTSEIDIRTEREDKFKHYCEYLSKATIEKADATYDEQNKKLYILKPNDDFLGYIELYPYQDKKKEYCSMCGKI